VLSNDNFHDVFSKRDKKYMEHLSSIQTCVNAFNGTGEPFIVMFYAPADPKNLDEPIDYDYKAIGEDVALLQSNE
jgi:hypothetical protein